MITLLQLEDACRAHDREESAMRGEPDPWGLDDLGDGEFERFKSDRLSCMRLAFEAAGFLIEPTGFDRAVVAMRVPPARIRAIDAALRAIRSKGIVGADEYRALLEDLPVFARHAAQALGTTEAGARARIAEGRVRAEPFLTRVEVSLRAEFTA